MTNVVLFLCEGLVYVAVMVTLLHLRHRLGLGVFIAALGVLHFIETYLAAVFYVQLPFGVISPGSAVLFAGKLMMILLLYVKEDAATVRQPIYGLLAGNFLTVALGLLLQMHQTVSAVPNRSADLAFIDEMGWLMLWGTLLLYLDSLLIILLYERIGRWMRGFLTLRFLICGVVVLTFDQAGFYLALHALNDAPAEVFWGGWIAKMGAAVVYSLILGAYLHFSSHSVLSVLRQPIGDIFNTLTFRGALRGPAVEVGTRHADRRARSQPFRVRGAKADPSCGGVWRRHQSDHDRCRSFQEHQRPLRPSRRRPGAEIHY